MPDAVLTRDGPVSVPQDYRVPQSGELLPLTVRATIDGTSAASSFYATVQVLSPSGRVMGSYISDAIAAGASRDVTWFPGFVNTSSQPVNTPGSLLGTLAVSSPQGAYTTTNQTLTRIGGSSLAGLSFQVPFNGQVYVRLDATIHDNGNFNNFLGLVDGTGAAVMGAFFAGNPGGSVGNTGDVRATVSGGVPGLNPGDSLTWYAASSVALGGTVQVNVSSTSPITYEIYTGPELA